MSTAKKEVSKFTLSSGKMIYLRDALITDQEACARLCGDTKDNVALMGVIMTREMFKQLLVGIQEKGSETVTEVNPSTLKLDNHFTYKEYQQAQQAVKIVTGGDDTDPNALGMELVTL